MATLPVRDGASIEASLAALVELAQRTGRWGDPGIRRRVGLLVARATGLAASTSLESPSLAPAEIEAMTAELGRHADALGLELLGDAALSRTEVWGRDGAGGLGNASILDHWAQPRATQVVVDDDPRSMPPPPSGGDPALQHCLDEAAKAVLNNSTFGPRVLDPHWWEDLVWGQVLASIVEDPASAASVFEALGSSLLPGPFVATALVGDAQEVAARHGVVTVIDRQSAGSHPQVVCFPRDATVVLVVPGPREGALPATLVPMSSLTINELASPLDPLTPVGLLEAPAPDGPHELAATPDVLRRRGAVLTAAMQVGLAARSLEVARQHLALRGAAGGQVVELRRRMVELCMARDAVRGALTAKGTAVEPTQGRSSTQLDWLRSATAKVTADAVAHAATELAWSLDPGDHQRMLTRCRAVVHGASFGTRAQLTEVLATLA